MSVFDGLEPACRWLADELLKKAGDAPLSAELVAPALSVGQQFMD
jgi:hypothetical protein